MNNPIALGGIFFLRKPPFKIRRNIRIHTTSNFAIKLSHYNHVDVFYVRRERMNAFIYKLRVFKLIR